VHIYVHYICVQVYTASVYILLWWESLSRCTCIYTESVHICIHYICIYIYTASACILPWWINSVVVYEFSIPYFISFFPRWFHWDYWKTQDKQEERKGNTNLRCVPETNKGEAQKKKKSSHASHATASFSINGKKKKTWSLVMEPMCFTCWGYPAYLGPSHVALPLYIYRYIIQCHVCRYILQCVDIFCDVMFVCVCEMKPLCFLCTNILGSIPFGFSALYI